MGRRGRARVRDADHGLERARRSRASGRAACSRRVIGEFNQVDCIAGTLIARESGARVRSRSGADRPVLGEGLLCAAPGVADELVRAVGGPRDGG